MNHREGDEGISTSNGAKRMPASDPTFKGKVAKTSGEKFTLGKKKKKKKKKKQKKKKKKKKKRRQKKGWKKLPPGVDPPNRRCSYFCPQV